MAIDNGIIDHDHQLLISITSDFCETRPNVNNLVELQRIVARLHHYINLHFAREEHLQAASNFPLRREHHASHRDLAHHLDHVARSIEELERACPAAMYAGAENDLALVDAALTQRFADVHHELSALLRHWVLEHILKSDLAMRPHVEAMRPYAAKMSSLWAVKPVLLVPNLDKPEAAKHAIASAKGWMNAAFRDESQPPPEAPAALPTRDGAFLAKLHQKAREIGMTVTFDSHCENVQSKDLRDALAAWRKSRAIGPGSQHFSFTPTPERNFVECTALLQRTEMASGAHRYRAISTGAKYARIFGDIAGHNLEVIEAPAIFARWKLLIDAVLEFGAPLRIVGLARAFGRDDLAVESILAPFQDRGATVEDVLGATSYDLSFEG